MRWRRGFFRIWVVASVIWVIVAAVVAFMIGAGTYVSPKAIATLRGEDAAQLVDLWGESYSTFEAGVKEGGLIATEVRPGYSLFTLKEMNGAKLALRIAEARRLVDNYVSDSLWRTKFNGVSFFATIGVGFPLVILLLGWAVSWALIGFRDRKAEASKQS